MKFDSLDYRIEELTLFGETIRFRSFRNIPYVDKPVNLEYQQMNIFVPECYYNGESINGYTLTTAPVFMPNTVGGYRAGAVDEPRESPRFPGKANTIFRALQHGYVVAAPAIRGRTEPGGKAPAFIVDYKAAVRYLHYFADQLPGDEEKIISNGTSAGGALSALIGASGNHPDYDAYLNEVGAADAGDSIFAASCYCPITNLDHADMAYEWQFFGVNTYKSRKPRNGEEPPHDLSIEEGILTEYQKRISEEEAVMFPAYVNALNLKDEDGTNLILDEDGEGTFKEYIRKMILESAQRALERGEDLSGKTWLTIEDEKAAAMDFHAYVRDVMRMKTPPAFDDINMNSPENHEFGEEGDNYKHFTAYSLEHSTKNGKMTDTQIIKVMNPMNYLGDPHAETAPHWRIRHGECDCDTSLAISAILAVKLRNLGYDVDYHLPWNTPHSGDYDIPELFEWIDEICKQ